MLLSDRYAELRDISRVRDQSLFLPLRIPNELELQARWFAGEFGKSFVSTAGDKVEIIQFGTWNREAGPDFRDVVVGVGGAAPVRGSIEIDLMDRSWETHGHAANPAFEDTVLHVFVDKSEREFFTRTVTNRNVTQVCINPSALPQTFAGKIPLARPGRCQAPLKDLPEERVRSILHGASQFRLRRKAGLIRARIEIHGRDEALYQEIAAALGYKENKLAFTLLAQRLPLGNVQSDPADIEPLLFGLGGFLDSPDLGAYKGTVRDYLRHLWDRWWPHRDGMQRMILPQKTWHLTSTRPANHPQRRLAALALVVQHWPAFTRSIGKAAGDAVRHYFAGLKHPFWDNHYTLVAEPMPKPIALIGESRISEILANVLFPFWTCLGVDIWPEYSKLPASLSNRRLETGATRLFGDDPRREDFLRTVANQQGLLQIYEDFCLQDNSDCARCPFPEQMRKW
ncbi:MAG TPA: DUF2851 family protein [Chthoniobacterales bacterium]|jgi:hypothetical protein